MDEQQTVNQTPTQSSPLYQESGEKNAKWLWLLIILIIIGALAFAYFKGIGPFASLRMGSSEASPTPETAVFSSPSPLEVTSPSPSVNKKEPNIKVLNGSGVTGAASSMKDLLEQKGWNVIGIGNAPDDNTYTQTVLKFKTSFKSFESALTADLSSKYSVITSSDPLESSNSADIQVIVGTK
ncbi:MAG TPA: LytR C-terminal domain-containing protein [Candidatus Saccharimonadales bacterium]|nr:LytR C-terminal domain-containing protein [Candidatus Saccharimonadales bacterium]